MAIEVRILGREDAAVLSSVAPGVFDEEVLTSLAKEFACDDRHHMAVAVSDGVVVGFASGVHYVHPDKPAEMWINEVGVAPTHQRQGIGRAVVQALLDHARSIGCREAWVLTDYENVAARKVYGACGGEEAVDSALMVSFVLRDES